MGGEVDCRYVRKGTAWSYRTQGRHFFKKKTEMQVSGVITLLNTNTIYVVLSYICSAGATVLGVPIGAL